MDTILLVIQIILALLIIVTVLLQRSENDGFGLGSSGGGGGLISARGQANLLTRTTAILAFLFMANSLIFNIVSGSANRSSIVDEIVQEQPQFQVPLDASEPISAKPVTMPESTESEPEDSSSDNAPQMDGSNGSNTGESSEKLLNNSSEDTLENSVDESAETKSLESDRSTFSAPVAE